MRRIALLVGNASFAADSGISNLKYPAADVMALAAILSDPEIGRFDRVETLIDKSKDEILTAAARIFDDERGSTIFFYYSGHGKVSDSGRLYLAASNTTDKHLPANGVRFDTIVEMKEDFGCGRFCVVLDCCYAGLASDAVKGSKEDQLKSFADGRGIFFLGAANATTSAREEDHLGHGVLTAGILEGLSTGKADILNVGRITGPDLFAWCRNYTTSRNAVRPVQVNKVEGDELVIAFSKLAISDTKKDRLRLALSVCWENRLLAVSELEQIRAFFFDNQRVRLPDPGTLEFDFIEYSEGKIRFDELLLRRRRKPLDSADVSFEGSSTAELEGLGRPHLTDAMQYSKACNRLPASNGEVLFLSLSGGAASGIIPLLAVTNLWAQAYPPVSLIAVVSGALVSTAAGIFAGATLARLGAIKALFIGGAITFGSATAVALSLANPSRDAQHAFLALCILPTVLLSITLPSLRGVQLRYRSRV